MSEMTDRFEMVAAGFDQTVRSVPTDKWDAPSPCEGWTARDVVGHVVRNYRGVTAEASGVTAEASGGEATELGPGEDPAQAWTDMYARMRALAQDPEALARPVPGPAGPAPLEQAMGTLISIDTHIHTWDLARAVGEDVRLDPGMIRLTRQMLEPFEAAMRQPGVFGPKLDPPPGADEQTQLLYFLGRRA